MQHELKPQLIDSFCDVLQLVDRYSQNEQKLSRERNVLVSQTVEAIATFLDNEVPENVRISVTAGLFMVYLRRLPKHERTEFIQEIKDLL